MVDSISSGSGMGSGEMVPIPYQSPVDIVLSSSGGQILLYFFSDASLTKAGFEIAYWLACCVSMSNACTVIASHGHSRIAR